MSDLVTVGFVGVGRMGGPICHNVLRANHSLVVHTRSASKAEPLLAAGAAWAGDLGELVERADVVLTCLDTLQASEQVYLGSGGLLASGGRSRLFVEHSTISDALAQRIGGTASALGVEFLDAPLSGGPEGAQKGTLAIMVGGAKSAFERVLPVLRAYGETVVHFGAVGSGTRAKLVNQLLTFVHAAAAAEAIALAQRTGLNLQSVAELLRASFGHSRMLDRTLERVQSGHYAAGAALSLFEKDLGIVRELGDAYQLRMPVAAAASGILSEALAAGFVDRDIAALRLLYP
jgi:3-hydroxyisobutyrate dehydrogenase-like beta-hydroxyacid dehydrogenase